MYLNEDMIAKWALKHDGLLITRSIMNLQTFEFNRLKPVICVITGYKSIIYRFFSEIIHKLNRVLLIIIESDVIELKKNWLNNEKLIHCYTWNKPFNHEKLSAIPIGLNFKRHYRSILSWIKDNKISTEREKMLCFNCCLNTSIERKKLKDVIDNRMKEFCDKLDYIKPLESKIIPSNIEGKLKIDITNPKCYDDWNKYKFILSPQGAGLDCHRTWEAIILGCIPIVLSSSIDELYEDLPIVIIDSWDTLNVNFLNEKYNEIMKNKEDKKYNFDKLILNYWTNIFEKKINDISIIERKKLINIENDIHFITYGDEKYKSARNRLIKQAEYLNIFTSVKGYSKKNLTPEFLSKYEDIINMPRGGGYWLWKIDIIKQTLSKINENDYIVYLDAGCYLNNKGLKRLKEYIDLLSKSNYGILGFKMKEQYEKYWTTSQIFHYFNIDENNKNIKETGQLVGGVLILRKNDHLRKYLNEFEKCIEIDRYLITDKYNKINQKEYFKDNRHDQSISSIIRKKIGSVIIDSDESWVPPFGRGKSLNYPFWAVRSKQ